MSATETITWHPVSVEPPGEGWYLVAGTVWNGVEYSPGVWTVFRLDSHDDISAGATHWAHMPKGPGVASEAVSHLQGRRDCLCSRREHCAQCSDQAPAHGASVPKGPGVSDE